MDTLLLYELEKLDTLPLDLIKLHLMVDIKSCLLSAVQERKKTVYSLFKMATAPVEVTITNATRPMFDKFCCVEVTVTSAGRSITSYRLLSLIMLHIIAQDCSVFISVHWLKSSSFYP